MSSHLCALILFVLSGVFGDTDAVKSVSVTEGDSVTLNTDVTEVQRDDQILWMFGPRETRIAELYKQNIDMFDSNEIFGHRLQMDSQTGSLTIRNIRSEHSGLYKLQIRSDRGNSDKIFNVTVYAPLPIPVIRGSSHCSSSSSCSLVCSAVNVSHVTLSWYKGNSLLSSISVSDLSISLSLPLEVEYQDKNTYSCVLNNPIRNQTKHLDNISQHCWYCSNMTKTSYFTPIITIVCVPLLLLISACVFYCCCRKYSQEKPEDQERLSEYTEIIYRLQI
ncbi:coxsackievirus and adenovirus receptor homolog [Megalobrama amblycephala]|uniref:coxsackievirus and adenovirus receptor homolog n=1 Tax=Megalobrama amblycephala TaxID=75352 RepID=UPI0020143725|nr:coxsackievirus and adenovirus receptor homolog [Megalobrama amblycephala]